eukprot:9265950-Alexandrium_andersonii.AAC.1
MPDQAASDAFRHFQTLLGAFRRFQELSDAFRRFHTLSAGVFRHARSAEGRKRLEVAKSVERLLSAPSSAA